jgi:Leucine-rich repeat (LRR) protein
LYLIENNIRKIKGLEMLINLKELYLYSNRIAKIENLATLSTLEVQETNEATLCTIPVTRAVLGYPFS